MAKTDYAVIGKKIWEIYKWAMNKKFSIEGMTILGIIIVNFIFLSYVFMEWMAERPQHKNTFCRNNSIYSVVKIILSVL